MDEAYCCCSTEPNFTNLLVMPDAPPPLPKSQPFFKRRHLTMLKLFGVGALILVTQTDYFTFRQITSSLFRG